MSGIRAVAARAGVSISTVSRVFTASGSVSPDTLSRVMQAAGEIGYVAADPVAVALRTGARGDTAAGERDAIVAWLRGKAGNNPSPVSLAAAIERGDHRR